MFFQEKKKEKKKGLLRRVMTFVVKVGTCSKGIRKKKEQVI